MIEDRQTISHSKSLMDLRLVTLPIIRNGFYKPYIFDHNCCFFIADLMHRKCSGYFPPIPLKLAAGQHFLPL
jgi:hypothetical protein